MSAQISAGPQSLRRSAGSSTANAVSQHTPLHDTLASFGLPTSVTIRQLYALLSELDEECLRHATAQDSTSDVDSVVGLAMFLSGSLSQCGNPGTFRFQEIQLRALVSSLALLQHNQVHSLDLEFYDKLRLKNLSARFQTIAFQLQRNSTLADRIHHAPNVYLVQLASHYAAFIKRGDSPWPSVFGPLTNITFAALSLGGGQYGHIRDIIGGLVELGNIRQKPRAKYQALCGVQEYTRIAVRLCRESAIADESIELRKAIGAIVTSLIDQVDKILAEENANFPSKLAKRWHKALAFVSLGPPNLDQGWYYYGLLDCVSQLAAVLEPQILGEGLLKRVEDLIFGSVVPEYRWKAIEILLSCHCTRPEQYRMLESNLRERGTAETNANALDEIRIIRVHLDKDEEEGLRLQVSRPLSRVSGIGTPIIPPEPEGPSTGSIDSSSSESELRALTMSLTKSSTKFSLRFVKGSSKSYLCAGLFDECRHAYFNNDSEVSVYKLGDLREKPISPNFHRVFFQQYQNKEFIRSVASSRSGIVIATNKNLFIFDIDTDTPIDIIPHGDWDPCGLMSHETETHLVVFLGQSQRNESGGYNGQIRVCRYRKDGQAERLPVFALNMLANDCPKRLFFDADSRVLTCITRTQNRLLVWELDDEFLSSREPFEFLKNNYTAEMKETGLTSARVYRSPNDKPYLFCTTAPSSERWYHDGEWSFVLPFPGNTPRSQIRPVNKVHNLEQFKNHGPLFQGCPSSQHHIFAVLEDSGRLSILRLDNHSDGGIHGREEVEILKHSLCKQDSPSTGCLRFDPSGSYLFAIDPKGKIVVTEFEQERSNG